MMRTRRWHIPACTFAVSCALLACSRGKNEAEFVQACMTGPQEHTTRETCQCAAREASARLSPQLFRVMVLDMQGKKQELEAEVGNMSFDDRAAFAKQQFEILGKCLGDK
jgi:hypothetical protein